MKFFVKLPRGSPGPLTPSPALIGTTFFFQNSIKGLEEHGESLPRFLMSLFEVFVDLMDHDKTGDGVRGLREPLGRFLESFIKIKPLEPCQDYPFPLWSFMES